MGAEEKEEKKPVKQRMQNKAEEPMVLAGYNGNIISLSPAFSQLSRYTAEGLNTNGGLENLFESEGVYAEILDALQKGKNWEGHTIILDSRQDELVARIDAQVHRNGNAEPHFEFTFFDITRSKKNELVETRLLKAITRCTEVLFSDPDSSQGLSTVLETIGKALQVHRAYIYRVTEEKGRTVAERMHEWVRKGGFNTKEFAQLKSFNFQEFLPVLEILKSGNQVSISPRSRFDRGVLDIIETLNIYSLLTIPIFIDNQLWGYIGFEDLENTRDWGRAEKKALKSLAHNIGALLKINNLTAELVNKNRQLENAIEGATDGLWVWDIQNQDTYISSRMYTIFGYAPGEWGGDLLPIRNLLKTEDTELLEERIKAAVASRQVTLDFETVAKHKKGRYVWVKGTINFTYDANGNVIQHSGSASDISTEKLYELKIRRQEEHYQRLVNSLKEVVFETDRSGNITFLNNSWKNLTGRNIRDSLGKKLVDFVAEANVGELEQVFTQLREKQIGPGRMEMQVISNGIAYWTEIWLRGLYDSNYELTGVTGSIFDINSKKLAEAQLRESEERYRLLSENTKDIICLHDAESRYLYVSPSMQEMLGYPARALVGGFAWACIHPDDVAEVKNAFGQIIKGKHPGFVRYRVKHRKGHYVWVETVAGLQDPHHDKDRPVLIQTATRDISQQKKAEEEIINALEKERELVELRTNLINMISHEFRTPLTTIKSSSDLMVRYLPGLRKSDVKDRFSFHFKKILEQVNRINDLISGVLLLGRMDSGKIQYQPEVVDFVLFINESIERYSESHPEETRTPIVNFKGTPRDVKIDQMLVSHILNNLISNALKYSAGKKNPELNIKFDRKLVQITIKDYGIGIAENDLKNLFQSFYRGSNALTIPGTGLGLVIVKQFVEMHGGTIELESKLNRGTTIQITLPI